MNIGNSIRNWFWKGAEPLLEDFTDIGQKLEDELSDLKKLVRRQGIQQESLVREISTKIDTCTTTGVEVQQNLQVASLSDLADSFFHLEAVLVRLGCEDDTLSALKMVWGKLINVCDETGLEIIRESGVPFDSRLHEALNRAPDGEHPVVMDVTSPGFIHHGRVTRPARVVLSNNTTAP